MNRDEWKFSYTGKMTRKEDFSAILVEVPQITRRLSDCAARNDNKGALNAAVDLAIAGGKLAEHFGAKVTVLRATEQTKETLQ